MSVRTVRPLRYATWIAITTWALSIVTSSSLADAAATAVLLAPAVAAATWPLLSSVKVRTLDVHSSRFAVALLMGLMMFAPTLYVWFVPSLGLLFAVAIGSSAGRWQIPTRF